MPADSANKADAATERLRVDQESADRGWPGGQWTLTLLPAVPILLLVGRLWHLSRQDLPTMLLLVQQVSPLGLLSALVITLMGVPSVVVLIARALGALLVVSAPNEGAPAPSWSVRRANRIPDWVVTIFAVWAALTWQMRFLPALMMIILMIVGLTTRHRYGDQPWRIRAMCVVLPGFAIAVAYVWLAPAIVNAFGDEEIVNALLLLLPPGLTILLTGPIPAFSARFVIQWPAAFAAFFSPFLVVAIFLEAPILPAVALEVDGDPGQPLAVIRSNVVSVDDRMTTLLDDQGSVLFVLNDRIKSKTLCPGPEQIPYSVLDVRGWHVEQSALEWILPSRTTTPDDPRCQGRPLVVP